MCNSVQIHVVGYLSFFFPLLKKNLASILWELYGSLLEALMELISIDNNCHVSILGFTVGNHSLKFNTHCVLTIHDRILSLSS